MLVVDGHQLVAVAEHVADCLSINADDSTGNPLQQCTRSPTVRHDSSVTTGSYRSGPARGVGSCTGVPGWWTPRSRLVTTVMQPGPRAVHARPSHSAADRSSMPMITTSSSGGSTNADSTQRWPKVSKCGATATRGTRSSAGL